MVALQSFLTTLFGRWGGVRGVKWQTDQDPHPVKEWLARFAMLLAITMADKIFPGEEKLWEKISGFDPAEVCKRTGALYDRNADFYLLSSFGFDFSISLKEKEIRNVTENGEILTKRLAYFFNPSILSYLVNAKEIALSGRLIKPVNMRGGEFFFQGSHMLPLNKVAERYGEDKGGFISRGEDLCGRFNRVWGCFF